MLTVCYHFGKSQKTLIFLRFLINYFVFFFFTFAEMSYGNAQNGIDINSWYNSKN